LECKYTAYYIFMQDPPATLHNCA